MESNSNFSSPTGVSRHSSIQQRACWNSSTSCVGIHYTGHALRRLWDYIWDMAAGPGRGRGGGGGGVDGGLDRGWCLVWSLVPRSIFWERDIGTKMSAGTSSPPRNFCERLPALCVLSSFIDEHEQWIDSLLQQLGWQRDSLSTKVMNHMRDINQHARGLRCWILESGIDKCNL